MVTSTSAQRGTIQEEINHLGKPQFVFRTDPRFAEQMEIFIYDGDVEECERPSDAEVHAINTMLANNRPLA
jgi:hypothetical protein